MVSASAAIFFVAMLCPYYGLTLRITRGENPSRASGLLCISEFLFEFVDDPICHKICVVVITVFDSMPTISLGMPTKEVLSR
jgi:hypothetical protein